MKNHLLPVCLLFAAFVRPAEAAMMITEFMYQGQDTAQTEFVEFTNVGSTPIDMTGWSFDDDSNQPGSLDLSGFGIVEPWQSVVITDALAADFRALWNLDPSVKIIGESDEGLARNDIMYLYNASNAPVDVLAYGDQNFPGSPRPRFAGFTTNPANYGTNDISEWYASTLADGISFLSDASDVGSPGIAVVPEPSAFLMGGLGIIAAGGWRRR